MVKFLKIQQPKSVRVVIDGIIHAIELVHSECPIEPGLEMVRNQSQRTIIVGDGIVVPTYIIENKI